MNTDNNQIDKPNDELLAGSGPDRIGPDTPTCPDKNVQCNYWTDRGGCMIDVCWMKADSD